MNFGEPLADERWIALVRRAFDGGVRTFITADVYGCGAADEFDLLLLHNPDSTGYGSDRVWTAMSRLVEAKLTDRIAVAPGPANGFKLDLLLCFERFGPLLDWAMSILKPLEPWPGQLVLPAAIQHEVNLVERRS